MRFAFLSRAPPPADELQLLNPWHFISFLKTRSDLQTFLSDIKQTWKENLIRFFYRQIQEFQALLSLSVGDAEAEFSNFAAGSLEAENLQEILRKGNLRFWRNLRHFNEFLSIIEDAEVKFSNFAAGSLEAGNLRILRKENLIFFKEI